MCWHKWNKWIQIEVPYLHLSARDKEGNPLKGVSRYQVRHCEKCGYIQEKEIDQF